MPNSPTTSVPEDGLFEDNFYLWLEDNGVELDDQLDDGEWTANIDLNVLKLAIMRLRESYGDRRELEGRKLGSSALKDQLSMRYFSDAELLDDLSYELHEYHKVLESQKEKL